MLSHGLNVITPAEIGTDDADLLGACQTLQAALYRADITRYMVERMILTMIQGVTSVEHVRFAAAFERPDPPPATEQVGR
jgi:hypothetical protein